MSETRKHHYVPVFYQKHFTEANGLLWVYDRRRHAYQELHPRSICVEKDLYSIKLKDRPRDRHIETKYLSRIDALSAVMLAKLATGARLNPQLLGEMMFFAALQYTRVPANGEYIKASYEAGADDLLEVMFWDIERARASLARYEKETGEKSDVSAESMVEAVKGKQLKAVATEMPFLDSISKHTQFLTEQFSSLDWQILFSPQQVGFTLSDNPVAVVSPPHSASVGILKPGTFTFVPLTRRFCLRLGPRGSGWGYREIDRENVRFINQYTAINKYPDGKGGILRKCTLLPRVFFYP